MFVSAIDNIKEMFDFKQKYKDDHLGDSGTGTGANSRRTKRRSQENNSNKLPGETCVFV
jgi:hypothetical protein